MSNFKLNFFLCSRAALDPLAGRVFETAAVNQKKVENHYLTRVNRTQMMTKREALTFAKSRSVVMETQIKARSKFR